MRINGQVILVKASQTVWAHDSETRRNNTMNNHNIISRWDSPAEPLAFKSTAECIQTERSILHSFILLWPLTLNTKSIYMKSRRSHANFFILSRASPFVFLSMGVIWVPSNCIVVPTWSPVIFLLSPLKVFVILRSLRL